MLRGTSRAIAEEERKQLSREQLKKLPPDQAIELFLLNLPPERRLVCLAGWEAIHNVTETLQEGGYVMDKQRVLTMLDVVTEDIPDLLYLSPEESMPQEFKQLFRSWISLIEHSLPRQKILRDSEKDRAEINAILAACMEATKLLDRGFQYFGIRKVEPRQVA